MSGRPNRYGLGNCGSSGRSIFSHFTSGGSRGSASSRQSELDGSLDRPITLDDVNMEDAMSGGEEEEDDDESLEDAHETAEESPPPAAASAGRPSIMDILSSTGTGGGGGLSDDPEGEKRKAIQAIMRDSTLSPTEKNLRVQKLMDGRRKAELASSARAAGRPPNAGQDDLSEAALNCVHYERKCCVVAPCCNKVFGCRVCHDELAPPPGHTMDRYAVREVVCKVCRTRQPASNNCIQCGVQFAEYHCGVCNIWMALSKKPFHCKDCGFCRVGGREAFRHCPTCCMCISVTVFHSHNCMRDKYKNNCPVCTEDMFSSRQAPQDLPCGHAIHAHCFRKLSGFDYRCPVCKKTVVSRASMTAAWSARARDIAMQPMPPDLARVVNIMCNDCETKSENCNFHFLGVQCPNCSSFNTQVHSSSDDNTGQFPQGMAPAS